MPWALTSDTAFNFLINSESQVQFSEVEQQVESLQKLTNKEKILYLVNRFKSLNMDVVLVDLTTDELRDVGLHVVRAVIPGLVPMTAAYRSRFLGHPRLFEYPKNNGFGKRTYSDINPNPQPFA